MQVVRVPKRLGARPIPVAGRPVRARPGRRAPDRLSARRVRVRGRRASYAIGGEGLPVLFLHGWGLGHAAYHRSLRRLIARGCRVIAPSLPGFGGTECLPRGERSFAGYAAWVEDFLGAVGVEQPLLVLGHSFGGGVATRFAHDVPDRTRYLVLLNSVGDPTAFSLSGARVATVRSPIRLPRVPRWRPSVGGLVAANAIRDVFVRNVLGNPVGMVEVAGLALTADLRAEMAVLAQRGLPVLVLWSDRDGLIPLSAFDTFCAAFGIDGHVVSGGHSWLLTNPDVFGEVLDNVIRLQRAEHGSQLADANADELRRLLDRTTMPRRTAAELVRGVSPMWVLSETPAVLAADLALCHPELAEREVRAVARPMPEPGTYRLTVAAADRPGLLADTAATLSAEGFRISAASVTTWPRRGLALHAATVHATRTVDDDRWRAIGRRLAEVAAVPAPPYPFRPTGPVTVRVEGEAAGGAIVRVTAPDGPGLLSAICRWFADRGQSIAAAHIDTTDGMAEDVFLVEGDCDTVALAEHLQGGGTPGLPRLVSSLVSWLPPCRCTGRLPRR